ncbi:hypothetical protein KGM_200059 [Danaus plexippus plexippus]|uniref:Uncharacterized protein n=1 Tax=Danaus plexippus plexippus TaxID=278856 RepID=A0A212F2T9_DANPL|nr:hypothetical protein KGM_200059 [Danaus plexippus plexippus]
MANKINKELLNFSLQHLIQIRGKQLREQLVRSFNYWLEVPDIQIKNAIDTEAEIIAKQFIDALTGQGYEIYWRDNCMSR